MRNFVAMMLVSVAMLAPVTAQAATDSEKCLSGLAKEQGKYEQCVQKWLAKRYGPTGNDPAKLAKCRIKYAKAWDKLAALATAPCSGSRYVSTATTVTDNLTGLVWEKKTTAVGSGVNAADRHDVDNFYSWTTNDGDMTDEDGTAFTDFLADLNAGGGFGDSANGWRLPTFAELNSIVLPEEFPCTTNPCIDAAFGATQFSYYWSASTYAPNTISAWYVDFYSGSVGADPKGFNYYVRAVRSGL